MSPWQRVALELALAGTGIVVAWYFRRPKAVVTKTSYPPMPLEPWEEAAEFGGDVAGQEEDIVYGEGDPPVGTGHPDDLCFPEGNPGAPAETCVPDPLADPRFAPTPGRAPLGSPGKTTVWPLATRHRRRLVTSYWTEQGLRGAWGRHFGAKRIGREGEIRRHTGVDLFGKVDDPVLAPEDGLILAILPFHHGTWAVYVRTGDGRVAVLAEIKKYSWREFSTAPNQWVHQGQPLARLGTMSGGGHMLHFELYDARGQPDEQVVDAIRSGEMQWTEEHPPKLLQDPSAYLVDAATRTHRATKDA